LKIASFAYQPKIGWPDCPTGKLNRIGLSSYKQSLITAATGQSFSLATGCETWRQRIFEIVLGVAEDAD